jgi:metal transporter CNNM
MSAMVRIIHTEGTESNNHDSAHLMNMQQVQMIDGALKYSDINVQHAMTLCNDCFMLSIENDLNFSTISSIFQSGFSRIPIYERTKDLIVGLLLVKDLIFVDPEDEIPLRSFMRVFGRSILTVWSDDNLATTLSLFQRRRCSRYLFLFVPFCNC